MFIYLIVLCMLVVGLVPVATQAANEAACGTLGANCICSEPLNTNSYSQSLPNNNYYNPADTTGSDKQCSNEGAATGAVLIDSSTSGSLSQQTPVNSGEAWTRLPSGHSLSWILKQNDQSSGQSLSHKFATSDQTARRGMRFYRYYSDTYVSSDTTSNGCNSGKLIQLGWNGTFTGGPLFSMPNANMYDINTNYGYTQNMQPDCCFYGPGAVAGLPDTAGMRGKWWRFEFYMNNSAPGGPPTYWEAWMKNVTTPASEMRVLDTRQSMTCQFGCSAQGANFWWQSPMTDNLHVANGFAIRDFAINMFRSNNGTVCTGHIAHTHAIWTAWSTNTGQRIGGAQEVEGGGGPGGQPPATPTGGTVNTSQLRKPIYVDFSPAALARYADRMRGLARR